MEHAMKHSGNPALKESTFLDLGTGTVVSGDAGTMTLNGTANKTGFLLLLCVLTAAFAAGPASWAALWQRDHNLLNIAVGARTKRLSNALQALHLAAR